MDKNVLDQVLEIVFSSSFDITSVRSGNTTQHSGSLVMSDADKMLLLQLIMQTYGCDVPQAINIFKEISNKAFHKKVKKGSPIWIGIVLLCVFAAQGNAQFMLGILITLLLVLIWFLMSSRKRAMKKAWQGHLLTHDNILKGVEKVAAVQERNVFQLANKPILIALLVCVLGAGYFVLEPHLPEPTYVLVAQGVISADDESDMEALMGMMQGMSVEKAEETLKKANDQFMPGYNSMLVMAGLANRLSDSNLISSETAASMTAEALAGIEAERIDDSSFMAGIFSDALERVSEADADALMNRFAQQNIPINISEALGAYCGQRKDTTEIVELSKSLGEDVFLSAALANDDMEATQQRLSEVDSGENRVLIARNSAAAYDQPNDVLAFLRMAQEYNLKPTDCYPNGARLDWDLTKVDIFAFSDELLPHEKWLPVTMTEAPEPLEYESVPEHLYTVGKDDFESMYDSEYEGNSALGKDAFEIVLDTALMEEMPAEYIPEKVEELDTLLVMSSLYIREGTLRNTRYLARSEYDRLVTKAGIQWQRDYPTYAALQLVDLFDMKNNCVEHRFCYNLVTSPEIPENELSKYIVNGHFSISDSDIENYYLGVPDAAWAAEAKEKTIGLLNEHDWSLEIAILYDILEEEMTD